MPMYKKISADEAQSRRQDQLRSTPKGDALVKAMKAPPSWNEDARSARFTMTTQQVDRYGDIVMTGGGDTTEFERNPVVLLFHSSRSWPVGNWANLEKKLLGRPPRLEGDAILLPPGGPVKEVDEAAWMLANGGIRACSIGFVPDWDEVEMILDDEGKPTWGYRFNKWELVECSICSVPANPGALAKMAEGDHRLAKELLEDVLDNWARTPEGLLMPRSEFEAAYRTTVERIDAERAPAAERWPALKQMPEGVSESDLTKIPGEKLKELQAIAREKGKAAADAALKAFLDEIKADGHAEEAGAVEENAPAENDLSKTLEEVEQKATPSVSLALNVDTREAEAAIGRVSSMLDTVAKRFAKLFGRGEPEAETRQEPHFDPPRAPDPEEIAAALASAAAVRERAAALL
jgi:phage head maturation protease